MDIFDSNFINFRFEEAVTYLLSIHLEVQPVQPAEVVSKPPGKYGGNTCT